MTMSEIDWFHIGLLERVARGSLAAAIVASGAAAILGWQQAVGVALGAAVGLLLLGLHRVLLTPLLGVSGRTRRRLWGYWAFWLVKWPCLAAVFYLSLKSGLATVASLCVGATLIPAVAVWLALQAVAGDCWRAMRAGR